MVIQWPATSAADWDDLIHLEDTLIRDLPEDCFVDGHDAGSGEMNIFILTNDPAKTFQEVKHLLHEEARWPETRIAFRDRETSKYTILWPKELGHFSVA